MTTIITASVGVLIGLTALFVAFIAGSFAQKGNERRVGGTAIIAICVWIGSVALLLVRS